MMKIEWNFSLDQIDNLALELIPVLIQNPKIFLSGEMASGKTTLTKSIVKALGSTDEATSPSFSLINEYKILTPPFLVRHIDLYRLNSIEECIDLGIEDILYYNSIVIIEWPELIEPLAPENVLRLNLSVMPNNQRKLIYL
jgi:tRNA threonylcarbamoyladenosine biosynthesis protein TsaE